MVTAAQVRQLALVAERFGGGRAHLTTRQNVLYHFVPLLQVAAAAPPERAKPEMVHS